MKGKVVDNTPVVEGEEFIAGSVKDAYGKIYRFKLHEWHSAKFPVPQKGDEVEFVGAGEYAREVWSTDPTTDIVRRYPGPITLQPSVKYRLKMLVLVMPIGLGLSAFGILVMTASALVAIPCVVIGALILALAATGLVPSMAYVRLDRDGYEIRYAFRRWAHQWDAKQIPSHPASDGKVFRELPDIFKTPGFYLQLAMIAWCKMALGLASEHETFQAGQSNPQAQPAKQEPGPPVTASRDVSDTT